MEIKKGPSGPFLISIGMEERWIRTPGFDEPTRSGGEGRRRAQAPTVPSDQRGMSGAAANNPSLSANYYPPFRALSSLLQMPSGRSSDK